jgi:hypothetical protein
VIPRKIFSIPTAGRKKGIINSPPLPRSPSYGD